MGETTAIQWCDHTFNPWIGCAKVSAGCKFCYASVDNPARISRGQGIELWGVDAARKGKAESGWAEPARWFRAAVRDGVRRRVFCASQADVFEDRRDLDAHRERLWSLIESTIDPNGCTAFPDPHYRRVVRVTDWPGLDWLLLTKRPEHIMRLIPERWRAGLPPNVWIGTSVEDQAAADTRIPHLLQVPARVRFLSLEPLLGPVALGMGGMNDCEPIDGIHWLILGGESGPKARPCDIAWIRDLRDQGRAAGCAVFVKQLGAAPSWDTDGPGGTHAIDLIHHKGGDPAEWPAGLRVREFPVAAAVAS